MQFDHLQILPAIHAFCVTSTIAIASVFVLQTTWFVAWMAIDQRRIDERRNGFIPCLRASYLQIFEISQYIIINLTSFIIISNQLY